MDDDFFCHVCKDYVDPIVEDNSFSHEFGTEWIFDYHCLHCETHLYTSKIRPRPEFGEPEKDWMDYL